MKLEILRDRCNKNTMIGHLYINGLYLCYTLENNSKKIKAGDYDCILKYSNKFKKLMLEIIVENRNGILIHTGNSVKDTEGCILLGFTCTESYDYIYNSKNAFKQFWTQITNAVAKQEKIELCIKEV